jgi:hypothetical protein
MEKLLSATLEELKNIYSATYGLIPSGYHRDNIEHYILLFSRDLMFGKTLYIWQKEGSMCKKIIFENNLK